MAKKKKLSAEAKIALVQRYLKGELSQREASKIGGIGRSSIRRWISRYEAEGAAGFLPYERDRVYSPEMKEAAVRAYLEGSYSQKEICKRYGIRSDYQLRSWIKVYNEPSVLPEIGKGWHETKHVPCSSLH